MTVRHIPVRDHLGNTIGAANVDDTGIVTFILQPGSEVFGKKLVDLIKAEAVRGLSISFDVNRAASTTVVQELSPPSMSLDDRVWRDRINTNRNTQRY